MVLGAVDAEKHLVVVVLIPVEGQDPGAASLRVSTEKTGHTGQELGKRGRALGTEHRGDCPQELLRAFPLHQLRRTVAVLVRDELIYSIETSDDLQYLICST